MRDENKIDYFMENAAAELDIINEVDRYIAYRSIPG